MSIESANQKAQEQLTKEKKNPFKLSSGNKQKMAQVALQSAGVWK